MWLIRKNYSLSQAIIPLPEKADFSKAQMIDQCIIELQYRGITQSGSWFLTGFRKG
jgi:hypothetical protein